VHQVGSFEASYVPSLADMSRLDERFRIPDEVWSRRPEYASYGFAVFKLKKGSKTIHPMAMKFATATPRSLFFPTVHVHDGELHDRARFDHTLYYQITDGATPVAHGPDGKPVAALEATVPIQNRVPVMATRGVTAPDGRVFKLGLHGERANADTRVALT
jgi:hypothetical protein